MALNSKLFVGLTAVVLAGFASGCGETGKKSDSGKGQRQLGGQELVILEDGGLSTEGALSGSGTVAFATPLANEAASFTLTFSLEDQGSLALVGFAGQGLGNGAVLKLTRNGAKLTGTTATPAGAAGTGGKFESLDATGPLTLIIDMHNHEEPATHVLAWTQGGDLTEDGALFNSDLDAPLTGKGSGRVWGLELVKAKVDGASTAAPIFSH